MTFDDEPSLGAFPAGSFAEYRPAGWREAYDNRHFIKHYTKGRGKTTEYLCGTPVTRQHSETKSIERLSTRRDYTPCSRCLEKSDNHKYGKEQHS